MDWWEMLCEVAELILNQPSKSVGGLSQLQRGGIVFRMLAHNAEVIQAAFQTIWNWLKTEHLGLETVDLRKY